MRRDIKIDEIRALIALVDCGSLAKAAAVVGRTESALSLQLKRLEESAGATLLERQGRRLALTNAGHVVLDQGRKLVAAQHQLRSLASSNNSDSQAPSEIGGTIANLPIHAPMRVTVSPEGQFREMRPVKSFKENLGGSMLSAVYEYCAVRGEQHEPVDFNSLTALAARCTAHYVIAVVRLSEDNEIEVTELAATLGGDPSDTSKSPDRIASSYARIKSLLSYVGKIELPITWTGACILDGHQANCAETLAFPLQHTDGDGKTFLLASEVSMTERYLFPAGLEMTMVPAPELVQVSTDDVMPPLYLLSGNNATPSRMQAA